MNKDAAKPELINRTIDETAKELLKVAEKEGISTAFQRAEEVKPCPIGRDGMCCKHCFMGPCRITKKTPRGVCGADVGTIAARNFGRMVAAGASAHADHGRDMAFLLLAAARGETEGITIKDVKKLHAVAGHLGIETEGKEKEKIGEEVALKFIEDFGRQKGQPYYISRAPKKRQELWAEKGLTPRGLDREIVEMMHRTHMGVDQDPKSLLHHSMRTSLTDGWGGAMIATDISDILYGTPRAIKAKASVGLLKEDEVNIVVHGHEPSLSEMMVVASQEPEILEYAKSKGASGINLAGICCTANEVLMRQGIGSAGNFLNQELTILTGAVDAMVVDVQCIMESLADVAGHYHTKLITSSPKAHIPGAIHIEFEEEHAMSVARKVLRTAIDNFPNRKKGTITLPDYVSELVGGFSHEYIKYMQGGTYRGSFRPLNDAIMDGRIQGVVGIVGCNNPRNVQDSEIVNLTREFISRDILVVATGCGGIACGKQGLLAPETMEAAGPGLKQVCEAIGISPVLHVGSCVDNSRILTIAADMVAEGGLGDDISELPVVGLCPEWMSEKALAIGTYFVASGVYTIFGVGSPVAGSEEVTRLISEGWEQEVGGKLEFVVDRAEVIQRTVDHLVQKRKVLGITEYAPGKFGAEKVLMDMADRRKLEDEQKAKAEAKG
ncbi:MAG: anaerobic carbon-monoxide dehydrogenase catalytic subunit [Deltaproteobacteria bacterium]|nr:anaerobic carbon-monoxide dehydrogenase catalytic subunit [Deltaproteobacteria bacterium]